MFLIARRSALTMLVLGVFLAACGASPAGPLPTTAIQSSSAAPANAMATSVSNSEATHIKVAMLPFISFAPYYIAQDEGLFKQQQLDVEFVQFTNQSDTVAALTSGQVDVSSGLLAAGMFNTIAKGGDIRIVADKGYIDPNGCSNIALVARNDLVEENGTVTADKLRGLKLAHLRGSWLDYYAAKLLDTVGLKVNDLEIVSMPSPSVPEAMNSRQIDLAINNEPWITRLEQDKHRTILTPVHKLLPDSQTGVMLYGSALLNKNSDVGNRFMVAYLAAVRQYNQGKIDRNIEILSRATKLTPALLKSMCWPTLRADGSINTASVEDFEQWSVKEKLLDQAVPQVQYWDGSFLASATQQAEAGNK